LHIVKTDSKLHDFIDSWPEGYPFYTRGRIFYDNPFWSYGIFSKSISFWIGHAYAVCVNEKNKTVKCLGGISWGYRLPWWSLRPIMILPSALSEIDWQVDLKMLQEAFLGYVIIQGNKTCI
jgi:hypothetical protein